MLRILWILQGENTETERLASPGLAGGSSPQPGSCPQCKSFLLLRGWGWKPFPARWDAEKQGGCNHMF